ncbi:MAG: 2-oxo-4-hydroxy-4-carboxy-5-ureidoimidazoline decarboxylase [Rhodobacteraceae bacterium]|nr:2-oxo-4-hydroxy-4-carboxy-5-ureidoimidazoline decarboxylase [Paracoccaceae bacterium]
MTDRRFKIAEINALACEAFVDIFGDVAEHSPWVARAAYGFHPFSSREDVIAAFEQGMKLADHAQCLELIQAHPDLAGKAALAGAIAEDSRQEQAGAGLDTLTADEFARFTDLNTRYRAKFDFPFIFAVKGATKTMILAAFEERIENSQEEEFAMALRQIARIFRFRLEDRIEA